jgi:diacylglycerol kinase (ATP)
MLPVCNYSSAGQNVQGEAMNKPGTTGLGRIVTAAGCSLQGLRAAVKYESAFRQELLLFAVLVPAAFWAGNTAVEYALLIASLLLVLIVELLNSAIEAVVDRVGSEHHDLAGRARDLGSPAVMVSLLLETRYGLIGPGCCEEAGTFLEGRVNAFGTVLKRCGTARTNQDNRQ